MNCKNKHLCDCFNHCGHFESTEHFYQRIKQPKPKHTVKLSEQAKKRAREIAPSQFKNLNKYTA